MEEARGKVANSDSSELKLGRFAGPAVIFLAAFAAIIPELFRGASCGHDFDVHLVSWFDCLNAWRHGILYPHWTPSPNYGAGEPRFVFYPPFTWMLGAALAAIMPWSAVPIALTFLIFAATGLATRALARLALSDVQATLAGCIAIFSGYALFTGYERTAFPEFAGGFWLPLIILFALRANRAFKNIPQGLKPSEVGPHYGTAEAVPFQNEGRVPPVSRIWEQGKDSKPPAESSRALVGSAFDGSSVPLAIALAGAWLSNVPLGVMAAYLLVALAVLAAISSRSWAPILRAATGGALGLGLAAFYWLPAALERSWVDVKQATQDPGYDVEHNWLFIHNSNPALALHDSINHQASWIAVSMLAIAFAGFVIAWRRGTLGSPANSLRWWAPLAAIPLVVAFLCFSISSFVWHALPELPFIQYPWRWLEAVEAPMAIFVVAALWPAGRRLQIAVLILCAAGFAGALVSANQNYFQACYPEDAVPAMLASYNAGAGFEGMFEYAPPNSDITTIARGLPDACLVSDKDAELGKPDPDDPDANPIWAKDQGSCIAEFSWDGGAARNPGHLRMSGTAPQAGWLVLKLTAFPAWRVLFNGHLMHRDLGVALGTRQDGLIRVHVVKPGPFSLDVDWVAEADPLVGNSGVIMSRWVSAVSIVLAIFLAWFERRFFCKRSPGFHSVSPWAIIVSSLREDGAVRLD